MMEKILIYDCEIIKCIRNLKEPMDDRYSYCSHWGDFNNMGISVIGTWRNYDLINGIVLPLPWGKYESFINVESNIPYKFAKFQDLIDKSNHIIGFNSISFDDMLCNSNGISIKTNFDLLCEVRIASGQPPHYVQGITRGGYNLDNLALYNLGARKTRSGALAPQLWQEGKWNEVIQYCLNDVKILKRLYFRFINGLLKDPHTHKFL